MEDADAIFVIEGDTLRTDETTANVIYVSKTTDPNKFDTLFIEALATRIAAELAHKLSENSAMAQELKNEYAIKIAEARQADASEGTPEDIIEDTWLNARLIWSG